MKLKNLLLGAVLAIGLAGMVGCGKKQPEQNPTAPMVVDGVSVDLPKLQQSIDASGNADLQGSVRSVLMAFRYRQYDKALMEMEKIVNSPNLTAEQKTLASQVFDQVKQVATKAPAPAQ